MTPPFQTSLTRLIRFRHLILTLWTVLVVASLSFNIYVVCTSVQKMVHLQANALFDKDLLFRRWNAMHGGVYVPLTPETPINAYLDRLNIPELVISFPSNRKFTLMNPAYMTRQLLELQEKELNIKGHLTSLAPLNPVNVPDNWERTALELFEKGSVEASTVEQINDSPHFRLMRPFLTEQSCLRCHSEQGYEVGDVRGGLSISIPFEPFIALRNSNIAVLGGSYAMIWCLGTGGLFIGLKWYERSERRRIRAEEDLRREHKDLENAYVELKAAQSRMLQQEKLASIGLLAAGVAHEINNPMGFISSNLSTLEKYMTRVKEFISMQDKIIVTVDYSCVVEPINALRRKLKIDLILGDTSHLIDESLDGAARIKRIVQDLKNFSRVDQPERSLIDINECLETTINVAWNEIKYAAVLNRDLGDLPPVECFPQQINQVFLNLLINAAQAMETQGEITVRTWSDGNNIFISVCDTGIGIPPEVINRIFEPFFTTKDVGKGMGLGLSISYDIIKKHGGDISVDSQPGIGTIFTVRLPLDVTDE